MKNISMFIRGAIGIKKGLGLDEIEFDLKDKVGLVALAGPNGKGKTTFLELMSLYRTLASRKGSLKHHFCLRDSRVEHKFIYDGDEYHLIWKIDSGSDRSEAFILVNGESIVNGKNTEYDKFINEKFGSQTLFYNSVFCAQGSGNLSTMTTGKIKELFVEFLRIERLAEYEKQCKKGVAYCQKKIDVLSGKIETCQNELLGFKSLNDDMKDNGGDILVKNIEKENAGKEIEQHNTAINGLKSKSEKQKADITRKAELESELKKLVSDKDEIKLKIKLLEDDHTMKKTGLSDEMKSVEAILADKEKIFNASSRISNLEKWEKYFSECFECSMEEQARFDRDVKKMDISKDTVEKQIKAMNDDPVLDGLKTTLVYLEKRKLDLDSNDSVLQNKLKSAQNDFSLMQASQAVSACREKIALSIDPDCKSQTCPALEMVANAKKELPGLEKTEADIKSKVDENIKEIETSIKIVAASIIDNDARLESCTKDYDQYSAKLNADITRLNSEISVFEKTKRQLFSDYLTVDEFKGFYKSKLASTRALISSLKELSSKKTDIKIAEEQKTSIKNQLKQLENDFSARKEDHDKSLFNKNTDIAMKEACIKEFNDDIDLKIDDKIKAAETKKADSVKKQADIVKKLDELKENAAVLKNNLQRKEKLSLDLNSKQASETAIKKELQEWEYLRLACSKTGLQALEIDGAAPLITAEANTLLEKAFGLESQIKIITQDPESGKEVFWIKVIREDGTEDDFSNLSGGQKVWISKALSLGMTLVSKRKSGRDFMTLYADEEDGALDGEKALEFIQLYRSMMMTGDFETCFFISHNPEVVGMADHVIDFGAL